MVRTSKPALIFHVSPRASSIHLPRSTAEIHLSTFLNPDRFAVCLTKSDFLERCSKNWLGILRLHWSPELLIAEQFCAGQHLGATTADRRNQGSMVLATVSQLAVG